MELRGKYRTIVADPPWDVTRLSSPCANDFAARTKVIASIPLSYPTLSVEAIAALPVRDLAEARAHLYLWTINRYVEDAYRIARAWGFRPSTLLVWAKSPRGIGPGGAFSITTEYVLFARRGACPATERVDSTWWHWKRGQHSEKPPAFLDMVERVSPAPRLELFARTQRLGWDTWGNEALCHVDLAAGA